MSGSPRALCRAALTQLSESLASNLVTELREKIQKSFVLSKMEHFTGLFFYYYYFIFSFPFFNSVLEHLLSTHVLVFNFETVFLKRL